MDPKDVQRILEFMRIYGLKTVDDLLEETLRGVKYKEWNRRYRENRKKYVSYLEQEVTRLRKKEKEEEEKKK